jgi:hypothetical protein
MKVYYKLVRKNDLAPALQAKLLDDRRWQDKLHEKLPLRRYRVMEGHGDQQKRVSLTDLPASFLLTHERLFPDFASIVTPVTAVTAAVLGAVYLFGGKSLHSPQTKQAQPQERNGEEFLLICRLAKLSPDKRDKILEALDVISPADSIQGSNIDLLLENFSDNKNSVLNVAPQFVSRHFPLTYAEEMIYDATFAQHPLAGYERMLVPLEKYYKFLSEQSFNEFLTILVKLGAKKVELVHSENKLMKNALSAYAGHHRMVEVGGAYAASVSEGVHSYWGMEFEGKQISASEIPKDFLDGFPFHKNNGTLIAMIEGIRSGNRNRTYTVERSFTGSYGLDVASAIKVLGFEAGFDFRKDTYNDEKSTFNVVF